MNSQPEQKPWRLVTPHRRGRGLAVEFFRAGDRYRHVIHSTFSGGREEVCESVEGGPEQAWPASPPLQQIDCLELGPDHKALLLVGMAGGSHWSATVEAGDSGVAAWICFDIACRATGRPESIGSRYDLRAAFPAFARLEVDEGRLEIEEGRIAVIRPAFCDGPFPCTLRWRYHIIASHDERASPS